MKSLVATLLVMVVAILLIVYLLSSVAGSMVYSDTTERSTSASSYEQKTNHFPRDSYDLGPIQGSESPYKVNQWLSYEV